MKRSNKQDIKNKKNIRGKKKLQIKRLKCHLSRINQG
jgi:hypothetical protein